MFTFMMSPAVQKNLSQFLQMRTTRLKDITWTTAQEQGHPGSSPASEDIIPSTKKVTPTSGFCHTPPYPYFSNKYLGPRWPQACPEAPILAALLGTQTWRPLLQETPGVKLEAKDFPSRLHTSESLYMAL